MRMRIVATLMAMTVIPGCLRSTPAPRNADVIARREYAARHLPGLSVVVLKDDDTLFAGQYGAADVAGEVPVDATTVFQLGSIGKQFLAALVVALAGDGALSLDDPAARYLPGFPLLTGEIRIRHLLSHTSGIRELFTLPEAQEGFDNLLRTRDELVEAIRKAPIDFAPGSRWSYSNTNYTMLALIVEKITGRPYEDVLGERFFRPLELTTMGQCPSVQTRRDEARGYEWKNETNVVSPPENMNWIRGDGGLCGSAADLARWTRLLATGRVIPRAAYEQMIAPTHLADGTVADYGFGLSLVKPDGVRKIAHNGAMRGFSASAAYYPDTRTTVVVLTNRGDVRTEAIERVIAREVLELAAPDRQEHTLSIADRQSVIGKYDIGVFNVTIVDRGGQLWFEMPRPGPTFPLRHVGNGVFINAADPDSNYVRLIDTDGPGPRMEFYMGAMHWYGRKGP